MKKKEYLTTIIPEIIATSFLFTLIPLLTWHIVVLAEQLRSVAQKDATKEGQWFSRTLSSPVAKRDRSVAGDASRTRRRVINFINDRFARSGGGHARGQRVRETDDVTCRGVLLVHKHPRRHREQRTRDANTLANRRHRAMPRSRDKWRKEGFDAEVNECGEAWANSGSPIMPSPFSISGKGWSVRCVID